jgi:hypothetical protein
VVAAGKREKIRLDLALCELSWLRASISTLLNQCLIVEPIHSVHVAQLALVSRLRYALNAKYRDAQTAIQRRSRSNDGLDLHVWMQSRLCGNSETLRVTFYWSFEWLTLPKPVKRIDYRKFISFAFNFALPRYTERGR